MFSRQMQKEVTCGRDQPHIPGNKNQVFRCEKKASVTPEDFCITGFYMTLQKRLYYKKGKTPYTAVPINRFFLSYYGYKKIKSSDKPFFSVFSRTGRQNIKYQRLPGSCATGKNLPENRVIPVPALLISTD